MLGQIITPGAVPSGFKGSRSMWELAEDRGWMTGHSEIIYMLVSQETGTSDGCGHSPSKALIRHKVVLAGPLRSRTRANLRSARHPQRSHTPTTEKPANLGWR